MENVLALAALTIFVIIGAKIIRNIKNSTVEVPENAAQPIVNPQITDAVTVEIPVVETVAVAKKPRKPRKPKTKDEGNK